MVNSKIRVIQILAGGYYGGAERSVQWFAEIADRKKFEYYFLFLYAGGAIRDELSLMGYPTVVLGWKNGYSLSGRLRLITTISKIDPHLIHDHQMTPLSRVFMKLAAKAPIISSQHGLNSIKERTLPILKWDDRVTDLVIANSNFTAQKHSLMFARPLSMIKTIYLGINPDDYRDTTHTGTHTDHKKKIQIAFIGRLEEYKGALQIPLLARALLDQGQDFVMNVIGDGPMLQKCRRLAADLNVSECVSFLGSRSQVVDVLHDADLFVFLSLAEETFGLVLVEAVAAGLPVFAYSGGGVDEALANAPMSWLIPKGDYKQMAALIVKNKGLYIDCDRSAGYRYIREKYNITRTVAELEQIYQEYSRK